MADAPGTPPTPWLDLLDEDIPVVDKSGKKLLVKGLDFVDPAARAAASKPAPGMQAAPPANLPVASAVPAAPQPLSLVQKAEPVQGPPEVSLAKVTKDDFNLNTDKDAADLKKIQDLVAAKAVEPEKKAEVTLLDDMVDQAVNASGIPLADEDVRRRYRMLISLYFRDLRDGLETKSKFTMPVQSGGMGMSDPDADRVIGLLQAKNDEYHASMTGKAADNKAKYVAEQTEKMLGAQDATDRKENQKMEQAFSGLLERAGVQASGAAAASPMPTTVPPKEPKVVTVVGLDTKGQPTPVAPAAPTQSAAPTMPPGSTPVTVTQAPAAAPTEPTAPMQPAPGSRPLVADVKFSPKLTGPVEELRSMSLKDFRRLSRDPREATLKLKDKIDLLEEQSFDVKNQGIKAWQDSEVNKLYLDILRKSLEGKPITDVITDLEARAMPALTKPEFDSIMDLNRKLRFG